MSSAISDAPPLITEAETRVAVATQRQLIWWRFRKHKLALISAVIVGLFYLVALFADVLAYAPPFNTEAGRSYIASGYVLCELRLPVQSMGAPVPPGVALSRPLGS